MWKHDRYHCKVRVNLYLNSLSTHLIILLGCFIRGFSQGIDHLASLIHCAGIHVLKSILACTYSWREGEGKKRKNM